MKHVLVVEVITDEDVTTEQLVEDITFTMGADSGVAGGYIGEPDEHAFYKARAIRVYPAALKPHDSE